MAWAVRVAQVAVKKTTREDWGGELTDEMKLFLDLHHPHVVACYGILHETDSMGRDSTDSNQRVSLPHERNNYYNLENDTVQLQHCLPTFGSWAPSYTQRQLILGRSR